MRQRPVLSPGARDRGLRQVGTSPTGGASMSVTWPRSLADGGHPSTGAST